MNHDEQVPQQPLTDSTVALIKVRRLEKLCSTMETNHAADMAAVRRELDAERAARAALEQQLSQATVDRW